jgi:hypothetical protein
MHFIKPFFLVSFITCSLISAAQQVQPDSTSDDDVIFTRVEAEAVFPGGVAEWSKYLQTTLKGNVAADNGAPVGKYTVIARFIVNKKGIVSDVKAETNFGYGMEEEVIRVINKSGKWQPAFQNGRAVKAYRRQPVTFIIDSDVFEIKSKELYTLFTNTDNELIISAGKVKPEDISLTVPGGKVTAKGDGKFIVKINKKGRVLVEIFNIKKDKIIGTVNMEVKSN